VVRLRATWLWGEERRGDRGLLITLLLLLLLLLLLVVAGRATVETGKQLLQVRHDEGG
jgi:Tfp pilus assembly protein PilX